MSAVEQRWYDANGQIPDRTNTVINGLLSWAEQTEAERIGREHIEDAVRQLTVVHADGTVDRYVQRVVRYGPFDDAGPARWRIDWGAVE